MSGTTYTDRLYAKPQEHTLYPRPQHRYECCECGAAGYHYPDKGEIWTYHACIQRDRVNPGSRHVWVYEDTITTQGTGDRVFPASSDNEEG